MYCIITSNEKIVKYAKRFGEEVVKVEGSVVIKNKKEKKFFKVTQDVVDNFLSAFPNIVMETVGTKALKYILIHRLGCNKNLYKNIYPRLARKYKSTQEEIARAIMGVYSKCITNMPNKYKRFFDDYECSVHWEFKYSYDFVKACQEYINKNYESLCKRNVSPEEVQNFLNEFKCISKKTLGYRCVKCILENQMECSLETKEQVYNLLAKQLEKKPSAIARGITNIFTSIMRNYKYAPEKFIEFYYKLRESKSMPVGERGVELVQIMQRYLEEN